MSPVSTSRLYLISMLATCTLLLLSAGCDSAKPRKLSSASGTASNAIEGSTGAILPPANGPFQSSSQDASRDVSQNIVQGNSEPNHANDSASALTSATSMNQSTAAQSDSSASSEADIPASARVIDQADLMQRAFMTLQPPKSDRPDELMSFLADVDVALRDLIVAGSNNIVDAATFTSSGLRLGQMKLQAGERLAQATDATEEQRKAGTISQLVALSHMSGLKDVESAKKLEKFATTLLQSNDPDLAHQGRVVLLGFRLQELQNGNTSDPAALLAELEGLFQRPSDAGFPEMMVLQQSQQVLNEMGFKEAADKIDELMVSKFMDAADPQLSMTAWGVAVANSQAFQNYNSALQDVYTGKETQPQMLLAAARGLFNELPNATTLLQFVNLSTDLEYRGMPLFATELSDYVKQQLGGLQESPFTPAINEALESQSRRLGVVGQSIDLSGLVEVGGRPLDWSVYKGKVVLIDFWATWCFQCQGELPNIRKVYSENNSKGFEVIAINMDDDLKPLQQYMTSNPFPWKTFHSADPDALGFKSEVAKRFGVSAIPFLMLVDADGKVAAVHVRGDRLAPAVQTLLGPGLAN